MLNRTIKNWNRVSYLKKNSNMKALLNVVYFGISITYGMHLDSISLIHITILNNIICLMYVPWIFVVVLVTGLRCYRCIPKGSNSSDSSEECMNSIDSFGKLQRCRNTGAACMFTSIGDKKLPRIIIAFTQDYAV